MGAEINWSDLVERAWQARNHAYAPYSNFMVGAALLGRSGKVFCGCNVENVSLGLTICAERSAICRAVEGGCRDFAGIAIVADTNEPVLPCGACRQFMAEFEPSLSICAVGRNGVQTNWSLSEIFPGPFTSFSKPD